MARKDLTKIFLSASIPTPDRDGQFYRTVDIVAIRDAVKALASIVIPRAHLIWGGHPSITPMIRYLLQQMNANVGNHVTLYQSLFFKGLFPQENDTFEKVILTEACADRRTSLDLMRKKMIQDNEFKVGIFIGGMEGIFDEYELFTKTHPKAIVLPIASTGAATRILFDRNKCFLYKQLGFDYQQLLDKYAYMSLFNDLLGKII